MRLLWLSLCLLPLLGVQARAQDPEIELNAHVEAARYLLELYTEGCLKHLGDPDAAVDWAITRESFQPAPDEAAPALLASGEGLAWIDVFASGGMTFAVSTTTYHCVVAADGIKSEVSSAFFGQLMFRLNEETSADARLWEEEITGGDGGKLTQTFVVFPRADGNQTILDITRPSDLSQAGVARFAATISKAD